mgnify:CR=1 FL=1
MADAHRAVLIAAFGCDTLGEFRTGEGEVYRGQIAGVNDPENCPDGIDYSFIRRGFPYGVTLELTFDPDEQYADPGTISTSGDDIRFNGFEALRVRDVTEVEAPHPYAAFVEKALENGGHERYGLTMALASTEDGAMGETEQAR